MSFGSYIYSETLTKGNLLKLLATSTRVTYFILWAHAGETVLAKMNAVEN